MQRDETQHSLVHIYLDTNNEEKQKQTQHMNLFQFTIIFGCVVSK